MINKLSSSIPGHVRIVFELPASVWADRIYLTGDFNDWCKDDIPLRQVRDGTWRVALDLPAGQRFQFRYLVDGQWQTDWQADGSAQNGFGSQNSVVTAELPEAEIELEQTLVGDLRREERTWPTPATNASRRARYPLPISPIVESAEQMQAHPAA